MADGLEQNSRGTSAAQVRLVGRSGRYRLAINDRQRTGCQAGGSRSGEDASPGTNSCIAVIDKFPFTRECIASSLEALVDEIYVARFATAEEALQDGRRYDPLLYCLHREDLQFDGSGLAPSSLKLLTTIGSVIVLSSARAPDFVVDVFKEGARAYLPIETTTLKLAIEILRLVKAGGIFVPQATQALRTVNTRPDASVMGQFTPRERAVLALLRRGKANKIIAHALSMCESTVKVHIRNIMRKMKVSNRTEIVSRVFAAELASAEPSASPDRRIALSRACEASGKTDRVANSTA